MSGVSSVVGGTGGAASSRGPVSGVSIEAGGQSLPSIQVDPGSHLLVLLQSYIVDHLDFEYNLLAEVVVQVDMVDLWDLPYDGRGTIKIST